MPGGGRIVIYSHCYDVAIMCHAGDVEREEANARLTATAPEMLESMQEMSDYLAEFYEEGREHPVIQRADAIISKALGHKY